MKTDLKQKVVIPIGYKNTIINILKQDIFIDMENMNHLKRMAFAYWEKVGPNVDNFLFKMLGMPIESLTPRILFRWFVEWNGGEDKINKRLSKYNNQIFEAESPDTGTYDFVFKVENIRLEDTAIVFKAVVDGSGECYIETEHQIYDKIYPASKDKEIGWEVKTELGDIMVETLANKIDANFEILCEYIVVVKNFKD